jgi:methylglutaconyl-CoA hydratase
MEYTYIESLRKDQIGYIVLNRVDKRNALNYDFVQEIKQALTLWSADDSVKVVIIKANGSVFSAGADLEVLKQLQKNTFEENLEDSRNLKELYEQIQLYPKVVIAQVEGHAIAGGCGLATICDFCFSVPEAQFGYTEVKIGFIPALVSVFLVRKIGEARAKEMLLTGKLVSAEEAKAIGMIQYLSANDKINQDVYDFASRIAKETSQNSIAMTKKLLTEAWALDYANAMDVAASYNAHARETTDCQKGITAFLNKESIVW